MPLQPISEDGYLIDLDPAVAEALAGLPAEVRARVCCRIRALAELACALRPTHPLWRRLRAGTQMPLLLSQGGFQAVCEIDPVKRVLAIRGVPHHEVGSAEAFGGVV